MPDPAFIAERRDQLLGIVATHAHEDHIGAIPYLWSQLRCPVWATPFTASVLRAKLVEVGLADRVRINIVPMSAGSRSGRSTSTGHSFDPRAQRRCAAHRRTVLHTGDWKLDPDPLIAAADEDALRRLGDEGVVAMICNSTNALRPGTSGARMCASTDRSRRALRRARICLERGAPRIDRAYAAAVRPRCGAGRPLLVAHRQGGAQKRLSDRSAPL